MADAASVASASTVPFWAAAGARQLVVQVDRATGVPQFYPRPIGLASGTRDIDWIEVTGEGHIAAVTSIPSKTGAPTLLATVELDERVRLLAAILAEPGTVGIGTRVRVVWRERPGEAPMFAFKPA